MEITVKKSDIIKRLKSSLQANAANTVNLDANSKKKKKKTEYQLMYEEREVKKNEFLASVTENDIYFEGANIQYGFVKGFFTASYTDPSERSAFKEQKEEARREYGWSVANDVMGNYSETLYDLECDFESEGVIVLAGGNAFAGQAATNVLGHDAGDHYSFYTSVYEAGEGEGRWAFQKHCNENGYSPRQDLFILRNYNFEAHQNKTFTAPCVAVCVDVPDVNGTVKRCHLGYITDGKFTRSGKQEFELQIDFPVLEEESVKRKKIDNSYKRRKRHMTALIVVGVVLGIIILVPLLGWGACKALECVFFGT